MIYLNGKTEKAYNADFIHWECSAPAAKLEKVTVPLRDGEINLSAMLSDVIYYEPRTITIGLELRSLRGEWPMYWSQILEDLHGQEVEVIRSDDPNWFWIGTAEVGVLEEHGATAGVTITVTAQPFKRSRAFRELQRITMSGDKTLTINVETMRGYPEFECSNSSFSVTASGETWGLPAGKSEANGLIFVKGDNTITIHGAGTIIVRWRGGQL